MSLALLTTEEMYEADRLTIEAGTPGSVLMENAGASVVDAIIARWPSGSAAVLCGPGNNGGDGFVIARLLEQEGWRVCVSLLGNVEALDGDAATMAGLWTSNNDVSPLNADVLDGADLIVDALFGAGLVRDISGEIASLVETANRGEVPIVSVDVPSGVDGTTGEVRGICFDADLTVTFFRKKPGHVLFPGKAHCGEVVVTDIGIDPDALDTLAVRTAENDPALWLDVFPWPGQTDHKYSRGHSVILSGGVSTTGAARLAARGALRIGAGLVTVASPKEALIVNASQLTAVMVRSFSDLASLEAIVSDDRLNSFVIGPGNGVGNRTKSHTTMLLGTKRAVVVDADALSSFENCQEELFEKTHKNCVLTPHDGEFARIFPELENGPKIDRVRDAAAMAGCTVLLKGPDTVIASPEGAVVVNTNALATLATAGSGDVLAGFIAGLMAQGMPAFEAAAAGAWIHGEAACHFGPGLISEDLPELVPEVLEALQDDLFLWAGDEE